MNACFAENNAGALPAPSATPAAVASGPVNLSVRPHQQMSASSTTIAVSAIFVGLLMLCWLWDAPNIIRSIPFPTLDETATEGDGGKQIGIVLLLAAIMLVGIWDRGLSFVFGLPAIFIPVLLWCWLSVSWAIEPLVSLRRISLTTIIVLIVAYVVQLLPYRRVVGVMCVGFVFVLLADWFAIAAFPMAIHQSNEIDPGLVGTWRGLHSNKNEAGAFAALCLVMLCHETARTRSLVMLAAVLACAVFLFQTQSKTAMGCVLLALIAGGASHMFFNNAGLRRTVQWSVALVAVASIVVADEVALRFAALFDDPGALTGRVQIWPVLMRFVADHPLLGSGYGSYWAIGASSPILTDGGGWLTTIDHSHNGYLELLVHTGIVGLILGLVCLIVLPLRSLFVSNLEAGVSRSLLTSVLVFGFLQNLLETSLLNRANSTWVIMLVAYCLLAKATTVQDVPRLAQHSAVPLKVL